jgi:hypothetical protein
MCRLGKELNRSTEDGYHHEALNRPAQKSLPLPCALHFNSESFLFQGGRIDPLRNLDLGHATELFFPVVTKAADTNV